MSTAETLGHHLQAFTVGVDEIMKDYTESSVLFTADGPLRGPVAIRAFFEDFFTSSPRALLEAMTLVRHDVEGEMAYVVWKAEPFIPIATDTFMIRDGKIVVQTYTAYMAS